MFLYFSGGAILQDGVLRSEATGIFGDPNDLAATIVPAIALVGVRLTDGRGATKPIYLMAGAILLAAMMLANSRGGMLALAALFAGFVLSGTASRPAKIVLVSVALLALVAGSGR